MNETFSKVLQFLVVFWLILGGLAAWLGGRVGTQFVSSNVEDLTSASTSSGITILWNIMSFQVTEQVPLFITIILDILAVLTIIAIIMAVTNR